MQDEKGQEHTLRLQMDAERAKAAVAKHMVVGDESK